MAEDTFRVVLAAVFVMGGIGMFLAAVALLVAVVDDWRHGG